MIKRCSECGEVLGEEYIIWGELGQDELYVCLSCDYELTDGLEDDEIEKKELQLNKGF